MDTFFTAIRDLLLDKDISLTAPAAVNELWLTPDNIRTWLAGEPGSSCQVHAIEEINVNPHRPNYTDVTALVFMVATDGSEGEYLTQFTVSNQELFNALMDAT